MTEHFFEPGAEYDDATAYSAPEIIRTFRCEHVATMPDTGEPVAFGFMRSTALGWGGTGMGISHWRQGWNRTNPAPEREPSNGLKALAEANEREKAAQAARSTSHYFATKADREAFAVMFGDKLDTWFTPEFAAYVRSGVYPDEPLGVTEAEEPTSLPELVARLREHGLTAAADFFASVGPVVARDRVIPAGALLRGFRGNAYGDPDETPWPTLDQEAYLHGREEPERP